MDVFVEQRKMNNSNVYSLLRSTAVSPMPSDPEFEALKISTFQLYLEAQERDGFEGEFDEECTKPWCMRLTCTADNICAPHIEPWPPILHPLAFSGDFMQWVEEVDVDEKARLLQVDHIHYSFCLNNIPQTTAQMHNRPCAPPPHPPPRAWAPRPSTAPNGPSMTAPSPSGPALRARRLGPPPWMTLPPERQCASDWSMGMGTSCSAWSCCCQLWKCLGLTMPGWHASFIPLNLLILAC